MLSLTSAFSKAAHGSRYQDAQGFEGMMKKKTRDAVVGAVLGILKGQSIKDNYNDYRFVLKPGATATDPSVLEYYEVEAEPDRVAAAAASAAAAWGSPGKQEANPGAPYSPRDGEGGGPAPPKGQLLIDFRSKIEENGKSAGHGLNKFSITGKHADGEKVQWDLKVAGEDDYRTWLASLRALCKARWEENAPNCGVCRAPFTFFKGSHHCRSCGRCVCDLCSSGSRALKGEGLLPVRVCDPCMKELGPGDGVLGS